MRSSAWASSWAVSGAERRAARVVADRLLARRAAAAPGAGQVVVDPDVVRVAADGRAAAPPRPPSASPASARAPPAGPGWPAAERLGVGGRRPAAAARLALRPVRSGRAGPRGGASRHGSGSAARAPSARRRAPAPVVASAVAADGRPVVERRDQRQRPPPSAGALIRAPASAGSQRVEVDPGLAEGGGVGGVGGRAVAGSSALADADVDQPSQQQPVVALGGRPARPATSSRRAASRCRAASVAVGRRLLGLPGRGQRPPATRPDRPGCAAGLVAQQPSASRQQPGRAARPGPAAAGRR